MTRIPTTLQEYVLSAYWEKSVAGFVGLFVSWHLHPLGCYQRGHPIGVLQASMLKELKVEMEEPYKPDVLVR